MPRFVGVGMQTSKEADQMIAACQKAGVQFMDGTMWMHNPRTAAMMAKLQDENVMGKLRTVISTFSALGRPILQ